MVFFCPLFHQTECCFYQTECVFVAGKFKNCLINPGKIFRPLCYGLREGTEISGRERGEGGRKAENITKSRGRIVRDNLLTGESDPVVKEAGRRLMSGSFVISGRACARAVRVGSESYAARLAAEVKKEKRVQSELLGSMRKVTRITSLLIIPLGIVLFLEALLLRNAPVNEAVVSSAAALLGMLPKGLVLLISVSLAAGVIRLARMKILVQNIYSLETLAHVDTLCLDKTGTLTDGNLKVHSVIPMTTFPQGEADLLVRSYMAACEDNNATFQALPAGIQPLYGVVLEDAIRPHVKETLEFFRKEGVDVKIISGDHVTTVSQIARRAGLDRWGEAIDLSAAGKDLDYDMLCRKYSVFARVTPGQVPADGVLPRGAFRADSHGHDHPAQSAGSFFRGAEADGHVYSADPDFHGGGGEKLCALQPAQNLCLRHHGPGNLRGALPPALPV